jgi:hypothetical protein
MSFQRKEFDMRALISVFVIATCIGAISAQSWNFAHRVMPNEVFDAVVGPGKTIHVQSTKYYQLDASGKVTVTEDKGDSMDDSRYAGHSGPLYMPPAISVSADNVVHTATRHEGKYDTGYKLLYRRRNADGNWDKEFGYGILKKGNDGVGVAACDNGYTALQHTGVGAKEWGKMYYYKVADTGAVQIGDLGNWRNENTPRLRAHGNKVFAIAGKPDNGGHAWITWGNAGENLFAEMEANRKEHRSGNGRRGYPDLAIDKQGFAHLVYGATKEIYYNKYSPDGNLEFESDIKLFSNLGEWLMLSCGMAAVASSDNGAIVLAVACDPQTGDHPGSVAELLWAVSKDGGATWSEPKKIDGVVTHMGQGRQLPRLLAIENTFYLLVNDNQTNGMSVGIMQFEGVSVGSDIHLLQVARKAHAAHHINAYTALGQLIPQERRIGNAAFNISRIQDGRMLQISPCK